MSPKGTAEVAKENKAGATAKKAPEPGNWQLLLTPRSPEPDSYLPIYKKEKLDKAPKLASAEIQEAVSGSVQLSRSVVSRSVTPWTAARQASLSSTNSRSPLKP